MRISPIERHKAQKVGYIPVNSHFEQSFTGTIVHDLLGIHQAYVTQSLDDAVARLKRMDASIAQS